MIKMSMNWEIHGPWIRPSGSGPCARPIWQRNENVFENRFLHFQNYMHGYGVHKA